MPNILVLGRDSNSFPPGTQKPLPIKSYLPSAINNSSSFPLNSRRRRRQTIRPFALSALLFTFRKRPYPLYCTFCQAFLVLHERRKFLFWRIRLLSFPQVTRRPSARPNNFPNFSGASLFVCPFFLAPGQFPPPPQYPSPSLSPPLANSLFRPRTNGGRRETRRKLRYIGLSPISLLPSLLTDKKGGDALLPSFEDPAPSNKRPMCFVFWGHVRWETPRKSFAPD